jgi:RNA polymerase sigma factor (sigma-70 family)
VRQQICSSQGQPPGAVGASQPIDEVLPALYARLRKRLGCMLYKHHIPLEDAEDLVQTTLLLAVARWKEIRNPEAWLLGTLHNRCIIYWRERMPEDCTRQLDESDLARGVEPDQTRCDSLADLGKVWHLLSPVQQRLLTLRYGEGLSPREAAKATGLACGSVRKTAHRAVARLREALALPPPSRPGGRGQWGRRQPAAEPRIAWRLRVKGGAAAAWMAAVDVFAPLRAPHLAVQLVRDLAAAGLGLGPPPLAELGVEDLERYRLSVDGRTPRTRARMLYSLRSFLLWAGERGDHALRADAVCGALRVGKRIRVPAAHK